MSTERDQSQSEAAAPATTKTATSNSSAAAKERSVSPKSQRGTSSDQYPYPKNDDILNHPYKLLSSVPRSPRANLIGRTKEPRNDDRPGPGDYDADRPRSNVGPRWVSSETLRMKEKEVLDVPYYIPVLPEPPSSARSRGTMKGFSILEKHKEPSPRNAPPGPGQYSIPGLFHSVRDPSSKRCTFGAPHKPLDPFPVPGPGAYDHDGTPRKKPDRIRGGKAPMVAKKLREPSYYAPGPGAYNLGSTFDAKHGACFPTIKGRLAHPMDDRNAAHECAKTSSPRNGARRMKARPHGF